LGEWTDVLEVLIGITSFDNLDFRIAAITTLGYIAQEVQPMDIPSPIVDKILSALINNMQKYKELDLEEMESSITAFLNFIIFASKNMRIIVK
jgi:hypothetical protein